jgi:hypothetical protein
MELGNRWQILGNAVSLHAPKGAPQSLRHRGSARQFAVHRPASVRPSDISRIYWQIMMLKISWA